MNTLLLNPLTWDLVADAAGNIAMATTPYAEAQDVGSAIKTFRGDYWYDITVGIPYFDTTLGHAPPLQLIKAQNVAAAMTVPNVKSAQCFISGIFNRQLRGQVQSKLISGGRTVATSFNR